MGRQSKVKRLPDNERRFIERLLREDRLTLSEMISAIRDEFPANSLSRSGLGRYKQAMAAITERVRGQREVARVWVSELGEDPDDKSGEMLVQTITALASDVTMRAAEKDDIDADALRKLARSVKDVIDARSKSLNERKAIREEARAEALRESRAKVEALGKSGAIDAKLLALVIKEAYGEGV